MNLIKLFGVSALVLGLAACGEADKAPMTDDSHAPESATHETAAEAVETTATDVVEAVKTEGQIADERLKSRFDTEKFGEGASGDVSTAPAPSFVISENLEEGEYINEQGEVVKNRDLSTAKENPKLREIPEGIEPGSVEHTMWLLEQEE
tara:strand:+ start:892 stop:1341 length:450 start_codon:yes stop_codon:yes gene_type:complete